MCWAAKCFHYVSLELGCILLAVVHFTVSTIMFVLAIIFLHVVSVSGEREKLNGTLQGVHTHNINYKHYNLYEEILEIKHETLEVVLGILICLCVCGMLCSPLLAYGVRKNKPGFVLSYFTYGTILVIILLLGALLEVLKYLWIASLIQLIISMIYIHCLVVVHSVYELMQRGKVFGNNDHNVLIEDIESIN